jgi:hypothetical protein
MFILASCSTSNDVVSNRKVQKRKYTKGFTVKKSEKKFFNSLHLRNLETNKNDLNTESGSEVLLATIDANIINYESNRPEFVNINLKNSEEKKTLINERIFEAPIFKNNKLKKSDTEAKSLFSLENTINKQKTNEEKPEPKAHWAAITGMICGILGLIVTPILFSTLGIVFGGIGISKIKKNPEKYKGKGMAVAGLVTGIIGVVIVWLVAAIILAAI